MIEGIEGQDEALFWLAENRERYYGAVTPPLIQSSNFAFANVNEMRSALQNEVGEPFYTRGTNPTTRMLEQKLAALEGAESALVFGSGSAAVAAAVMAQLKAGDHVICVQKPYSWTDKLLNQLLKRFGIDASMVNGCDVAHIRSAIKPNTKVLMLESPNSFTFEMQDIKACTALAKEFGLVTIMDNSYATPLNQQPLKMGVDLVIHSVTKYLAGHSDALAGVVCGSKAQITKIFYGEYMTLGAAASPFNSWLVLRGLRTLEIRLKRVEETTAKLLEWLASHPLVEKVVYPGHSSHPQYELFKQQMQGSGGMFALYLKAKNASQVNAFCNALKVVVLGCSWGGYESLAFPVVAMNVEGTEWLPFNLIRIYIGLESFETLKADFERGFEAMMQ
jgi:cystathionine beta-lyase